MAEVFRGIVAKARMALTDGIDFLLVLAGAGTSATVVEIVKSWFPEQTKDIADETLATAIGFVLFYFGDRIHPRLASFGLGVFIASAGAWVGQYVKGILEMFKKG